MWFMFFGRFFSFVLRLYFKWIIAFGLNKKLVICFFLLFLVSEFGVRGRFFVIVTLYRFRDVIEDRVMTLVVVG